MKHTYILIHIWLLCMTISCFTSCSGQDTRATPETKKHTGAPFLLPEQQAEAEIAKYIRHVFQDKHGHLWFGTNGYGAAHYDGDSISYFSLAQGFDGQQITGITEDIDQNIWFATDRAVVKYDWSSDTEGRKRFTSYLNQDGLGKQRFWSIFADSRGHIWAGAATGIFRYDGQSWSPFKLALPEEVKGEFITKGTTWSITEDRAGHMWFSTNGFGVFQYNGKLFTQYTKSDGLTDNSVDHIMEDSQGNMWFGTRYGGLSLYDGTSFTNYTAPDSIGNNEVCDIYEDRAGDIWFSSEGFGVYRYRPLAEEGGGKTLTNYGEDQGLGVRAVQTIFEDREGRLWVGGGGGLYRFDPSTDSFYHVTKNGPWE